jgi:hypothetical protein
MSAISSVRSDEAQTTIPTHRLRGKTARLVKPLHPFVCCADANTMPCGRLPVGGACFDSRDHEGSQALRIWSARLRSAPAMQHVFHHSTYSIPAPYIHLRAGLSRVFEVNQ